MSNSFPPIADYWTAVSSSGVALPVAIHPAEEKIKHYIDSIVVKCNTSSSTWTVKTGSRFLGEGDIGNATLTDKIIFAGDVGESISLDHNGTGTITITGHSQKRG